MGRLSDNQRAWMRAFEHEAPEEMAWLDADRCDVHGPPETWVYLFARWTSGRTAVIHTDERAGLEDYFDPGTWSLTPAGRQALTGEPG